MEPPGTIPPTGRQRLSAPSPCWSIGPVLAPGDGELQAQRRCGSAIAKSRLPLFRAARTTSPVGRSHDHHHLRAADHTTSWLAHTDRRLAQLQELNAQNIPADEPRELLFNRHRARHRGSANHRVVPAALPTTPSYCTLSQRLAAGEQHFRVHTGIR